MVAVAKDFVCCICCEAMCQILLRTCTKRKTPSTKKHASITVSECPAILSHDAPGGQEIYAPHDAKTQRESVKHSFWEVRKQDQEKDTHILPPPPRQVHQRLLGFLSSLSSPACPAVLGRNSLGAKQNLEAGLLSQKRGSSLP